MRLFNTVTVTNSAIQRLTVPLFLCCVPSFCWSIPWLIQDAYTLWCNAQPGLAYHTFPVGLPSPAVPCWTISLYPPHPSAHSSCTALCSLACSKRFVLRLVCVRACVCACVRACVCACVCVCVTCVVGSWWLMVTSNHGRGQRGRRCR